MKWQPIETAPKETNTAILLWLKTPMSRHYSVAELCDRVAIGFWQHGRWVSIETEDCGSMGGEYTGWMPDICPLDVEPSHWMPLPDPPRGNVKDQRWATSQICQTIKDQR